jgi:hypothetical protein
MILRMFEDIVPESEVLDAIPTETLEWPDPVKFLHEGTKHMEKMGYSSALSFDTNGRPSLYYIWNDRRQRHIARRFDDENIERNDNLSKSRLRSSSA